jgi:hypothetical protein
MLLTFLLASAQPDPMLLNCKDYDWLARGVYESELLTPSEKLEFISVFIRGTDPTCFRFGTKDAND